MRDFGIKPFKSFQEILRLTPSSFFCPVCGKWHKFKGNALKSYEENPYKHICINNSEILIWFHDSSIKIISTDLCDSIGDFIDDEGSFENIEIDDEVSYECIEYDLIESLIKFKTYICSDILINTSQCIHYCCTENWNKCNLRNIGDECLGNQLELEFKFKFDFTKPSRKDTNYPLNKIDSAKKAQEENHKQNKTKNGKEDTNMKNNIFNMNMEFGPNKDENIVSTLMGVAVKNGDSWRIYDKNTKEITDVGDMQLGNLPIFILPTTQLCEGDLIKDSGEYYFVTKVATSKTPTQTLSARTGELKSIVPIKNVLGFSCYLKVIALSDSLNMGDDFDVEKLAIMSAVFTQTDDNSGQMNQLLPLMLFKDKLGGDDDTMKLMLMSSMMVSENDNSQMNQLLPLMLFKDKLSGDDDTMKLALMSSMMGSNMAGSNNPLMSYLMLETFTDKKKE